MSCIVYKAENEITREFYIGVTTCSLEKRKYRHLHDAFSKKCVYHFHNALRKYGRENFEWSVLETHTSKQKAFSAEIRLIAKLKPTYNMTMGGDMCVAELKKVICLNDGFIFESVSAAGKYYNLPHASISRHCKRVKGFNTVAGRKFSYYKDGIQPTYEPIKRLTEAKSVVCLEDGRFFKM